MIDLHSHIVFNVDDGPDTLEESLSLIEEAYRQGIRTIVSTSHRRKGMFETPEEEILANFQIVKVEAEKRFDGLTILYGGELYYRNSILKKLETGVFPTLNGTRFALVEFSGGTPWQEIRQALANVQMIGLTPVVAHIERYDVLEFKEERVRELINMGCYMQVNSNHVLKPKLFGDKEKIYKKRGRYFLEKDLIHFISSDMHNLDRRPPFMQEAYQVVEKEYGTNYARAIFYDNAETILADEFI